MADEAVKTDIKTFIKNYWKEYIKIIDASEEDIGKVIEDISKTYLLDEKVIFVDPMGNAFTKDSWKEMMLSGVYKLHSSEIVSFDSIRILSDKKAAIVTMKAHEKYTYEGEHEDDQKLSFVLEKVDQNWKFAHAQWSTCPPPSE